MKPSDIALILLAATLPWSGCRQPKDPELEKTREQVEHLSKDNQDLRRQVDVLSSQVQQQERRITDLETQTAAASKSVQRAQVAKPQGMTVERARAELEPLLAGIVAKIKADRDTATAKGGFGMRTEFNVKAAVYGLIHNSDADAPYLAKVLVPSERFVVSESGSTSYGKETARFVFAYRKQKWVLISNE